MDLSSSGGPAAEECASSTPRHDSDEWNQMLWTLCRTSKLFCGFARSKLFERQYIDLHPSFFVKSSEFLTAEHIARNVKCVRLCKLDNDRSDTDAGDAVDDQDSDALSDAYLNNLSDKADTGDWEDSDEEMGPLNATEYFDWMAIVSVDLTSILQACAGSLEKLEIDTTSEEGVLSIRDVHYLIADILSSCAFPRLRSLQLDTDSVDASEFLWNPTPAMFPSSSELQMLRQNLANLQEVILGPEIDSDDRVFAPKHAQKAIDGFQKWVAGLSKLKRLGLNMVEDWDTRYGEKETSIKCLSFRGLTLHTLDLYIVWISDGLSTFLEGMPTLNRLILINCRISPEVDTWKAVLLACTRLDFVRLEELKYHYEDGDDCGCRDSTLCTPLEEDEDAFHHVGAILIAKGAMDDYFANEWKLCDRDDVDDEIPGSI